MAEVRVYRTYRWLKNKDPSIDIIRTILQDEGLYKNLTAVAEISSVSSSTLNNWFHGDTMRPMNATIMAVLTSIGYKAEYVKERKDIDLEKERKAGKAWLEKRAEEREKNKANGSTSSRKKPPKKNS